MSNPSLLKDIHDRTDLWTIAVRVLRKWNVYQKNAPTELFCVSLLLIDAEGTKIQASIINQSMHAKFCQSIKEGKTYEFANFVVSSNNHKYRPTTHPFKLTFTTHTYMMEEEVAVPLSSYSFKSFHEILSMKDDEELYYLFDVIGFVKCIGSLDQQRKANETKYKLRMILADVEENEIECILFDQCATDAYMDHLENDDTPVVVLLHLAKLGWTEDNKRQLSSSFNATHVSFNPQIKEVTDLIQSAKDRESPVLTALTQPMPTQMSTVTQSCSLHNQVKLQLADIPQHSSRDAFVLSCQLLKFESKYGWNYLACSKCFSKAKPKDEKNPNGPLVCPSCNPSPNSFEPKMKLHYIVKDESGTTSVIFWDKLAVQLMHKTALQMKLSLPEKFRDDGFPEGLEHPVGKNLLLKLKINDYNKKFPGSSISAYDFTVCEDLMNEFDAVSAEDGGITVIDSDKDVGSASEVCRQPKLPLPVPSMAAANSTGKEPIEVQDLTISNICDNVTQAPSKGKRRSYMKRSGPRDDSAKDPEPPANPIHDGRVSKVIKQEK